MVEAETLERERVNEECVRERAASLSNLVRKEKLNERSRESEIEGFLGKLLLLVF